MLNKKTYIRLFALVMALMMTVAVFAGCNNQEAIDEANKNAKDALDAVAEANKTADSLAQAAKDLAAQLKDAQAENDALKEAISAVDSKADGAHADIGGYHDNVTTAAPVVIEPAISLEPWEGVTNNTDLKAFTDLKNKYLVLNRDWYTAENYAALNKIFEDAAFEIYRAVDATGLEQIINDAATKAAQVDSIASDAAKVQALIAAFGDVPTEIFTTNEAKVIAAREAFDAWVAKYETCFFTKNGYVFVRDAKGNIVTTGLNAGKIIERDIVDFAKKYTGNALDINVNTNTNSLLYAEAKIAALYLYAEDAIKAEMVAQLVISGDMTVPAAEAVVEVLFDEEETQVNINANLASYNTVLSIVDKFGVTYAECKENGKMIEDAYTVYRIFWNANGGDDTPISGAAGQDLLTAEEFVKLYVLTLYNGELSLYENTVKEYLYNKVVAYFLNKSNTSAIATETGWTDYLIFNMNATLGYADNGTEVVNGLTDAVTFAVEFDRIDVYANGTKVDSIPADGVQIEKDFNRVAATAATKIFALDYDKDFKGNKSLEDAYIVIDQYIVEAITELTQVYYDDVVVPYLTYQLNVMDEELKADYAYTTGNPNSRINDYYYAYDNAFYANASKLIAQAKKAVASYKTATYAELNAIEDEEKKIKNIEDQKMFDVNLDAQNTLDKNNAVSLYSGDNAAMETILKAFKKTMQNNVGADLFTRLYDLDCAVSFHEDKIAVAEKLDTLVGIVDTIDNDGKITAWKVEGLLMKDFGASAKTVLGDAYKDSNVYNAISGARTAGRDAIMAVEFMNYDTAEALFTIATYQAKNAKGEALYYTNAALASAEIKNTAKDNKALNIVVDRYVVAYNSLIELFADGSDAVLKAFADLVRTKIQSNVTDATNLYKTNYDFGGLDHVDQGGVYLEKDMNEFIAYLNSLTNLAAIDAYTTSKFGLINNAVAAAKVADLTGYTAQTVGEAKNNNYLFHVTKFDKTLDQITGIGATDANGWYDSLAKTQLTNYFALTSAVAYAGLEDVRELAYLKDNLINGTFDTTIDGIAYQTMPVRLASFKGTWDAANGKWTVAPRAGYEYDMAASRTALYLQRLQEVYDSICADIAAITILSVEADKLENALDKAEDKIEAILTQTLVTKVVVGTDNNGTPNDPSDDTPIYDYAYDESDDKSLAMAYVRFYLVGQYDWVKYNTEEGK